MARSKGFQGIAGRVPGVTWGTAVAAGALRGVEVTSLDVGDSGTESIEDRQITGRVTEREASAGNKTAQITVKSGLRYEGNEPDMAFVFGTAGAPSTVDTTGKKHVFKIKDGIDGLFQCFAYEYLKDTTIGELPSVKLNKLTLRGSSGGRWEIEVSGIADSWNNTSAVNTTTTIDTITLPANREFAAFAQSVFRMNAQGGAGLGAGDKVYISAFEITLERAMESRVSTNLGDRGDEPIETDFAKVSGSFTVPALDSGTGGSTAFFDEQRTLTRKKADLTITSGTLAGSTVQFYQHILYLANLQIGKGRIGIPGPEGPTVQYPFMAYHATASPTGFPASYVDAWTHEAYSQRGTDALT